MTELLSVDRITCRHDASEAVPAIVNELSFELSSGEIGCLLGASGCGKTTVLRSIAGFHPISDGEIKLNGRVLSGPKQHLAPEKRRVGMVFQDYALFPHLSVCDNVLFGLSRASSSERKSACDDLLSLVKLEGLGHRFPHELSGGQQQRVALARALAPSPDLLLLDEPMSSLDTELRRSLALEVREILKLREISAILVTHDQEEAFAFADKVGVVNEGKIEQWDLPFNLYHEPQSSYVANFIGQGVFLPGFLRQSNAIETELGVLSNEQTQFTWPINTAVKVLLRPDDIVLDENSPYQAEIVRKVFAGTATLYTLKLPTGSSLEAALASHHDFPIGRSIAIAPAAKHLIAFVEG